MPLRPNLGDMLVASNLIDEVQMRIALEEQRRTGKKFGSTLVDLKFIDENVLAAFLSKQIDIPCISLLNIDIPRKVFRRFPPRLARECQAIPIRLQDGKLEVAMVDPTDTDLIQILETATAMTIIPLIAPQSSIEKMVDKLWSEANDDTLTSRSDPGTGANDPIFRDLIADLESGDYESRLQRIEESLNQIWILLEKVLRTLESREAPEAILKSVQARIAKE